MLATARTTTIAIPITAAFPAFLAARLRFTRQSPARTRKNFALIQPALDPDDTVSRVGFGEAVVDVGAQGVQRQLPLQVPFATGDFSSVQPARHAYFDAFAAE